MNRVATGFAGALGTYLVAVFVGDQSTTSDWRTVFITVAAVLFAGGLFYGIFGSGIIHNIENNIKCLQSKYNHGRCHHRHNRRRRMWLKVSRIHSIGCHGVLHMIQIAAIHNDY
jgi:hypothetical protein